LKTAKINVRDLLQLPLQIKLDNAPYVAVKLFVGASGIVAVVKRRLYKIEMFSGDV
jgi:hypothetical protein